MSWEFIGLFLALAAYGVGLFATDLYYVIKHRHPSIFDPAAHMPLFILPTQRSNTMTESVEQEIQRKGLTAPRVTPDQVEATIVDQQYFVFPGTMLTVCCLTLRNGFNVVGESACASPENFDEAIGRRVARDNAKAKIWALEGYLLRERLASGS